MSQLFTELCIILTCVCFSLLLPRLPHTQATHTISRLLVCVLVVVLCVCLQKSLGIPLALLLVLSSVPVMRLDVEPKKDEPFESFANKKTVSSDAILEQFSQKQMGEREIAKKMEIFTRLNSKQEDFKQQLDNIQKNLKDVREFYANEELKYKKKIS